MFRLRCTKKLLDRVGTTPGQDDALPRSTGHLGDWFANLLIIRRQQLVLAVSGVTLLPVLLPAAPFKTLPSRLPVAVEKMLLALGIEGSNVAPEIAGMMECHLAKTNSRRVLGSMLDFANMLKVYLDGRPLLEVALHLAESPCSPIAMECPRTATIALFGQVVRDPTRPALRLVKG